MANEKHLMISVIIPIRNEADFIKRLLTSVRQSNYPSDRMEILVIDGMSNDGTRDIVQEIQQQDGRVRLIDNPRKITPVAMNIGIRQAKGDLFTIIGGHTEISRDFLINAVKCLKEHPEVWVAGGPMDTISQGYIGNAIAQAMKSPSGVGNATFRIGNYTGYVEGVPFGTYHSWVVDKIGYFDEGLVRNQDDEFFLRIILGGGKIWMSPSVKSVYYSRASLPKLWRQYFQYGFWRTRTLQKHKRPAKIRQIVPLLFVSILLLLGVAGLFCSSCWLWLLIILALYSVFLILGALVASWKSRLVYFPVIIAVFAILHFGYGIGCLWGVVRFILFGGAGLPKPEEMKLSR